MQVKLTTHVHIVPRLRMRGAVSPLTIRFRSLALIMHKDHFHILWYKLLDMFDCNPFQELKNISEFKNSDEVCALTANNVSFLTLYSFL
jgi:hypothetical protein